MSLAPDRNLEKALDLAQKLLELADQGDAERQDIGCGIVFGTIRDCGYKIRSQVESEMAKHQNDAEH